MKEANCSFFHQIICAFRKEGFARLKGMESKMREIYHGGANICTDTYHDKLLLILVADFTCVSQTPII